MIATTDDLAQPLTVFGRDVGAGSVDVVAEVWFDDGTSSDTPASWDVVSGPSAGTFLETDPLPYRTYVPGPGATGTDSFTFSVDGSNVATVTLRFDACIGKGPTVSVVGDLLPELTVP